MKYNGIIIFGGMGSGKDCLADYIIKTDKRAKKYGLGDLIRSFKPIISVDPRWKDNERSFYQTISDKLREIDVDILNEYALSKMISENADFIDVNKDTKWEDINKNMRNVSKKILPIIVGGRTEADYNYWKKAGFLVVGIEATKENRLKRLIKRDGKEVAINSNVSHNTEIAVAEIAHRADIVVNNDGTFDDLLVGVKEVLKEYYKE